MELRRHGQFQALTPLLMSVLILSSTFARAQYASDDDLVKLARKHFNYNSIQSEQERSAFDKFFLRVHQGQTDDFTPEGSSHEDVSKGNSWGPERTVKAKWIMWLCKDPDAVKMVQSTGIQVSGAKIDAEVKLSWLNLQFPLAAHNCYFTDRVILRGASLPSLDLNGAYIVGSPQDEESLVGVNLTVQGNVNLGQCVAKWPVWFSNAKITERFLAKSAEFHGKPSLNLSSANIGLDVDLKRARALGRIDISRSTIGGNLDCSGAKIQSNGSDEALDAASAKIDGDVIVGAYVDEKTAENFDFNADRMLRFFAANVGGTFQLSNSKPLREAILDLRDANARILLNNEKSWPNPKNLRLQGFVFNELSDRARLDSNTQIKWLRLQSRFAAQPYEQLATVFRNMGLEEEGVDVNIAQNEDAGKYAICNDFARIHYDLRHRQVSKTLMAMPQTLGDLFWYYGLGLLIRYGYRPWNALVASLIVVGLGTVLFWRGFSSKIIMPTDEKAYEAHKNGHLSESYPRFNPFIYSLETFVPLVKLGIAQCWIPNPGLLRGYLWFHILWGWILTSLWVAAFAGLLKR